MSIAKNEKTSSCFFKKFILFLVPFLLFLSVSAGYLHLINLKIEIHTLIIIAVIFVIYLTFISHNMYIT